MELHRLKKMMGYGFLSGFIYDVGDGVGEFIDKDQESSHSALSLEEIVTRYVDKRNLLSAYLLARQIKKYIKGNMTADGLEYVDPPFNQDTSFPEDYFEGDLYVFLTNVLTLLDGEIKARKRSLFRRLTGRA